MVPNTNIAKAGPYVATGSAGEAFAFDFPIQSSGHVAVWVDGAQIPSGYTVVISSGGGHVTFNAGYEPASGAKVAIIRDVPHTQETDLPDNTRFYPHVLESSVDKLTMIAQQHAEILSRCAVVAPTDTETEDAVTVIKSYVRSAYNEKEAAAEYASSAYSDAQRASGYADAASGAALSCISAGGHTVSGAMAFNGGITVSGGVRADMVSGGSISGATISGGAVTAGTITAGAITGDTISGTSGALATLTVANSGGITINSEIAATQPWVLDQLGSSGFLQSYGGFTAWGEWAHSSSVNGIVTSVWGNRPSLTFSREFEVTVREGDDPDSSGRPGRTAVLSMDPADGYGAANITLKVGNYSDSLDTGGYVQVSSGRATVGVRFADVSDTSRTAFLDVTEHSLVISHFLDDSNGYYGTPRQYDAAIILSGGRVIATTGSGTSLHSGNVVIDSDLGEYMTSSGARTVVSGILSSGRYVNSSGARAIAEDVMSSGGVMPSGAIVSGAEFTTTVGDYSVALTSGGGMVLSGSSASVVLSGGQIKVKHTYLDGSDNPVDATLSLYGDTLTYNVDDPGLGSARLDIGTQGAGVAINGKTVRLDGFDFNVDGSAVATEPWVEDYVSSHGGGGGASGAIVSGAAFTTTVGGYTFAYDSTGFRVSGSGAAAVLSGGSVTISGGGQVRVDYIDDDLGGRAGIHLGYDTAELYCSTFGSHSIRVCGDGIYIDNQQFRPIMDEVVDQVSNSATIPVLSGGTRYIFEMPLTSLCVDSITSTWREDMVEFTLASGGVVDLPSCRLIKNLNFEDGKHYILCCMYGLLVVNEYEEV